MSIVIYAIINEKGFISAFVNAEMVPEIVKKSCAIPAPHEDLVLAEGKVWQWLDDRWHQVPDPRSQISGK